VGKQVDIEVEIDENGQVQVHVKGRKGKTCLEFKELIEQALGPVRSERLTQEYYEKESVEVQQTVETRKRCGE